MIQVRMERGNVFTGSFSKAASLYVPLGLQVI
jgi:hypothetical protein